MSATAPSPLRPSSLRPTAYCAPFPAGPITQIAKLIPHILATFGPRPPAPRFIGYPAKKTAKQTANLATKIPNPSRQTKEDREALRPALHPRSDTAYTTVMIALWTNFVTVQRQWIPALRRRDAQSRPNPEVVALLSLGALHHPEDLPATRTATEDFRALGIKVIPACAASGPDYKAWFDRALWNRMAETLAQLAQLRDPGDPRVAIDLEAYWDNEPRYPSRCHRDPDGLPDEYRVADAMAPLIARIKHEGISPWLLPGGMETSTVWHVATACADATILDEMTYCCPVEPKGWIHYETRKPAIEALGRGYLPGFYGHALRSPPFQAELQRRGINDYWIWFRAADDEEHFWSPGWSRGAETRPATPRP
jgi:hypothetical protein